MAETGERKRDEKQIEAAGEEEPKVRLFLLLTLLYKWLFLREDQKLLSQKICVYLPKSSL